MVLGVNVNFVLDRASKEGAEDRGFVSWEGISRLVVADCRIFAKGDADCHNLATC